MDEGNKELGQKAKRKTATPKARGAKKGEALSHLSSGSSLRAFSSHYQHVLPYPVAVIVGTATAANGVRAWSVRSDGLWEAQFLAIE
ncbi:hypothetical protein ACM7WR_25085 [Pseudomonas aeruginosa]